MKKAILSILVLVSLVSAAAADAPAYRAVWTGSGVDPTVTISPQVGDALFVIAVSNNNSNDVVHFTASDNQSGGWTDLYCVSLWKQGSKWAKFQSLTRYQLVATASSMPIVVNTAGKFAVAVVIAVSGLSLWDGTPKINGCGSTSNPIGLTNGNIRQVKARPYCIGDCDAVNTMDAGMTPNVPKPNQQQTAFLTTSLTIAIVATEESSPGITTPSGWTQRATVSGTSQGKTVALNVSTRDSGFSGTTITWGSTTPTDGSTMAIEVMPLQ